MSLLIGEKGYITIVMHDQKSGQILYCPGVPCRPPVSVSNTDWAFGRSSVARFDRSLQTRVSTRPAGKTAHECGDTSNGGT